MVAKLERTLSKQKVHDLTFCFIDTIQIFRNVLAIPVRMVEFVKSMSIITHVYVQREHRSQTVTIF